MSDPLPTVPLRKTFRGFRCGRSEKEKQLGVGAGVVGRSVVRLESIEEARKLLSLLITSVLERGKEK